MAPGTTASYVTAPQLLNSMRGTVSADDPREVRDGPQHDGHGLPGLYVAEGDSDGVVVALCVAGPSPAPSPRVVTERRRQAAARAPGPRGA